MSSSTQPPRIESVQASADRPLWSVLIPSYKPRHDHLREALRSVLDAYRETFERIEDPYFRERGADIQDVGQRVIEQLLGVRDRRTGPIEVAAADQRLREPVARAIQHPYLKKVHRVTGYPASVP